MSRLPLWSARFVCARDGHVVSDDGARYCPQHGSLVFAQCATCSSPWTFVQIGYVRTSQRGADFCAQCSAPAPWVSRAQLVGWIRDRVSTEAGLDPATVLRLQELLDRVAVMDATDERQVAVWNMVKQHAPAVWSLSRRVLETLLPDQLKKLVGL